MVFASNVDDFFNFENYSPVTLYMVLSYVWYKLFCLLQNVIYAPNKWWFNACLQIKKILYGYWDSERVAVRQVL